MQAGTASFISDHGSAGRWLGGSLAFGCCGHLATQAPDAIGLVASTSHPCGPPPVLRSPPQLAAGSPVDPVRGAGRPGLGRTRAWRPPRPTRPAAGGPGCRRWPGRNRALPPSPAPRSQVQEGVPPRAEDGCKVHWGRQQRGNSGHTHQAPGRRGGHPDP